MKIGGSGKLKKGWTGGELPKRRSADGYADALLSAIQSRVVASSRPRFLPPRQMTGSQQYPGLTLGL